MTLINKAKQFAIQAHDSIQHRRKYTDEPYHVHPERVAKTLASINTDDATIAAAWLHDVLEDVAPLNADFDETAIREQLGQEVLELVLEVTDVSQPSDGNRAARKALDREHLRQASPRGKTIKLADLIDNCQDIKKNDPGFYRVFRKEVLLDLPHLTAGDATLFARLEALLKTP